MLAHGVLGDCLSLNEPAYCSCGRQPHTGSGGNIQHRCKEALCCVLILRPSPEDTGLAGPFPASPSGHFHGAGLPRQRRAHSHRGACTTGLLFCTFAKTILHF